MTTTDHRNDIYAMAALESEEAREAMLDSDGDGLDGLLLDVEVFTSNHDRTIVELLLGCGGPTTRVTVDQYGQVIFFHSWGRNAEGVDLHEIRLYGDDEDTWLQIADTVSEWVACS